jgi:lipopolysaccharide/colanic/teichoic acid biosynthesis glycosyltransferase
MKRIFDIVLSLVGLLLLSPFLIVIALVIKFQDGGSVFFRGVRVGLHAKEFRIFKFRTMVVDAEKIGPSSTSDEDSRITRFGRSLRKHKLDELPQLINVLLGDMSIVGPRPEVRKFVDLYTKEEKVILKVKPGITDWASLWNSDEGAILAGSDDPDRDYLEKIRPEKIRLQLKYIEEQSFLVDMRIIFLTILAVLRR